MLLIASFNQWMTTSCAAWCRVLFMGLLPRTEDTGNDGYLMVLNAVVELIENAGRWMYVRVGTFTWYFYNFYFCGEL